MTLRWVYVSEGGGMRAAQGARPQAARSAIQRRNSFRRRKIGGLCFALLLLGTGGCARPKPPPAAQNTAKIAKPTQAELPGKLDGKGWHIPWFTRDPKDPNG